MASPSLALPGAVFVGEDERSRIVVHLGPAAGWMIPKGIVGWSTELSVVGRDALTEEVRREAKIVMPDEQVPPARMPLTHQALRSTPLIAVSGKLVPKLVERGVRVHTVGADRVTSSFYYIGEGGGEEAVRIEGDLVAAVGAMLGESADNAAIERVLDGLIDRLLRLLSRDRVSELSLELAAALPRAAADGSGMQDVDLESFEKDLSRLVGASEKYSSPLREIGDKVAASSDRRLDIPLFGEARKISHSPFELMVGERKVSLPTFERWVASGPFSNAAFKAQAAATPAPAAASPAPSPRPAAAPSPSPRPAAAAPAPSPRPATAPAPSPRPASVAAKAAEPVRSPPPAPISSPAVSQQSPPSSMKPLSAPLTPPRPASNPPPRMRAESRPAAEEMKPLPPAPPIPVEAKVVEPEPPAKVEEKRVEAPKSEPKIEPAPAPEPEKVKALEAEVEPVAPTKESAKVQAAPKVEPEPSQEDSTSERAGDKASERVDPKPVAKATRKVVDDEDRDATTRKIQRPEKSKSFTWILLVVAIAAIFAGYRLFVAN